MMTVITKNQVTEREAYLVLAKSFAKHIPAMGKYYISGRDYFLEEV